MASRAITPTSETTDTEMEIFRQCYPEEDHRRCVLLNVRYAPDSEKIRQRSETTRCANSRRTYLPSAGTDVARRVEHRLRQGLSTTVADIPQCA